VTSVVSELVRRKKILEHITRPQQFPIFLLPSNSQKEQRGGILDNCAN